MTHTLRNANLSALSTQQLAEALAPDIDGLPRDIYEARQSALAELVRRVEAAEKERDEALEYIQHDSWRCQYRSRYKECQCGLDDLCDRLGVDRVPPNDPEAPLAASSPAEKGTEP